MAAHASEPLFLPDSFFRSEAIGYAEIVRSLGGRARVAWELATGQNPFGDEAAATPLNPRGRLGVDLSGPPWGSALKHPVAVCGGRTNNGSMQGERRLVEDLDTAWKTVGPWVFWNRPHARLPAPSIAPYDQFTLMGRAVSSGNVTLTVRLETIDLQTGDVLASQDEDFAVTAVEAGFTTSVLFKLMGSGHVAVRVGFKNSSDADPTQISGVSLLQTVKRSH